MSELLNRLVAAGGFRCGRFVGLLRVGAFFTCLRFGLVRLFGLCFRFGVFAFRCLSGVIGHVPTGSLELNRRSRDPLLQPAAALRAFRERLVTHLLKGDRKSTRLNSSHVSESRMPSSA